MRTTIMLTIFAMVLFMAACVPSLHPLFTEKDLVFDPALVGTWAEAGENETWTFQRTGDKVYELTYTERGVPSKFVAHLVELGKFRFLDLYPDEPEIKNDFYKWHLIPAHSFSRIKIEGDAVQIAMLSDEWLKTMLDQKKTNINHERIDSSIVLTAPTKKLQEFVLKYVEDAKAFGDWSEMHRLK